MVRIRVHANGQNTPTYLLKVPGSWMDLVAAASERVGGAALGSTRLFLSADGAEIGSLEDLEEGDVVSVAIDGGAYCSGGVATPGADVSPTPPPNAPANSSPPASARGIASGIVKGMHRGAELLEDARTRGDTAEICNLLRQLARVPTVSRDLLAETGVGVVVGHLKRHEDEDVASMARQLVAHWKAMLEEDANSLMSGPGAVERQLERERLAAQASAREAAMAKEREAAGARAREVEQLEARKKKEAARAEAIAREAAIAETEAKRAARAEAEAKAATLAREAARAEARARQAAEAEAAAREAVRVEAEARERAIRERLAREQAAREQAEREAAERERQAREAAERRKAERKAALEAERLEAEARERAAREAVEAKEQARREAAEAKERAKREAAEREAAEEDAERVAAQQRRAVALAERKAAREAAAREAEAEVEAEAVAFEERLRIDQAEAAREVRRRHRSKTPADRAARAASRGRARPDKGLDMDPTSGGAAEARSQPWADVTTTLGANGPQVEPGLAHAADEGSVAASGVPGKAAAGDMQHDRLLAAVDAERSSMAGSLIENYAMDAVEGVRSEASKGGRQRLGASARASAGRHSEEAMHTLDHPTTRRADGPSARRPSRSSSSVSAPARGATPRQNQLSLKAGHLVLGAPLRQGRPEEQDYGLGLVCAASDTAYHLRFMWRHPLSSAGKGAPIGVCDNLRIDRRDMRIARYSRVKGTPPPPYLPSDREILEGGQLAAEAAGFRWRRLESDVTDVLGFEPPQQGVYS